MRRLAAAVVLILSVAPGAADDPPAFCVERHGASGKAFEDCVKSCRRVAALAAGIAALCRGQPAESVDTPTFEAARNLMILAGIRRPEEFEEVEFRFCPFVPAAGMAPAPDLILMRPEYRGLTLPVAALMGHEMVHIDQYRRWGAAEFACRYGAEMAAGHGTAAENAVEDEAYSGDEARAERLRRARLLPPPRPDLNRPDG